MNKSRRGIALLMTLSLLAVLSAALMASLEERSMEVRHQAAEKEDFFIQLQARSSFRAISAIIKTQGLWFVLESQLGLAPYKDQQNPHLYHIAIPVGEAVISELQITLLDHAFNLNPGRGNIKADSGRDVMLANLIADLHETDDNYFVPDVLPFLSALNDFLDQDSNIDKEFFLGPEVYYNLNPGFEVKNRGLDRLSEVKILPSYKALQLRNDQLERHFRIFGVEEDAIDVNLASAYELEHFFARFKGLSDYQGVYNRRKAIAQVITQGRSGLSGPKYGEPTSTLMARGSRLKQELTSIGAETTPNEDALFKAETSLLRMEYNITLHGRTRRVNALLELNWAEENGLVQLASMTLHEFFLS